MIKKIDRSNLFKRAWALAKAVATKKGGKAVEYFGESLKKAWADAKADTVENKKEIQFATLTGTPKQIKYAESIRMQLYNSTMPLITRIRKFIGLLPVDTNNREELEKYLVETYNCYDLEGDMETIFNGIEFGECIDNMMEKITHASTYIEYIRDFQKPLLRNYNLSAWDEHLEKLRQGDKASFEELIILCYDATLYYVGSLKHDLERPYYRHIKKLIDK